MAETNRLKPLAPASGPVKPLREIEISKSRRRPRSTVAACIRCRQSKAKCNGTRPECGRCEARELVCRYDVAEGVLTSQDRREKLKSIASKADDLEFLLECLRSGTDVQATTLLARLRLGDRISDILSCVETPRRGSIASDSNSKSSSSSSASSITSHPFCEDFAPSFNDYTELPEITPVQLQLPVIETANQVDTSEDGSIVFLSIPLFQREDYLLAMVEDDPEDPLQVIKMAETNVVEFTSILESLDNPVFSPLSPENCEALSLPLPINSNRRREQSAPFITRQYTSNGLRIHPNLQNLFGNLPFSDSIRANNYPAHIQDLQIENLCLPSWAIMSMNTKADPGNIRHAFQDIYLEGTKLIKKGEHLETFAGQHPNIAALFDEGEFNRSTMLSQWSARMVHSIRLNGDDFTCFTLMYIFWYMMRWMIFPSPETYEAIPEWMRPTPNQLFTPHINFVDFVIWPALRELILQIPSMQEHMDWLMEISVNIECQWENSLEGAICRHPFTGETDLIDTAKQSMRSLKSWSVGPAFRKCVPNADAYVNIRLDEM